MLSAEADRRGLDPASPRMSRLPLPLPVVTSTMRVGIFGGSFNPAHHGHLAISCEALKRLQLDRVWWLVSPQNPLKDPSEIDDFDRRVDYARKLVGRHPGIEILAIERRLDTSNTAATLRKLTPLLRRAKFAWIMGADSFANLHRWHNWLRIPETLPLAVFDRPGYTLEALTSPAAQRFSRYRVDAADCAKLPGAPTPAWCFISIPRRGDSSTAIRQNVRMAAGATRR